MFIAFMSWLKVVALVWMLFTSEKRDLSSVKGLEFEKRSFDKSFMWIGSNKGRKIEPCVSPTVTLSQNKYWPFRTTLCFQRETKSRKGF